MDRQLTFEILLYLNMFYTMFYAGIETIFFFMKYLYVPDFGEIMTFFSCLVRGVLLSWQTSIPSKLTTFSFQNLTHHTGGAKNIYTS